ncbi:MAG: UDP-3-O-acyl-N-acetylglucosamine deacetylase [Kiritimatiellae bacterium]|nr:UDP-3-O-acyl-N-acetylglucosamine deacetylase [Kiritimatiellia bacterium]
MNQEPYGVILAGAADEVRRAYDTFGQQPVDWDLTGESPDPPDRRQVTIRKAAKVAGPGTFFGREHRTLTFEPTTLAGWWFNRVDQPGSLPIKVSVGNVWTTIRNVVLRSGSPHNYMRMVEHIIALRLGLGIDNLMIKADAGDPPLFDRGSIDLVEALQAAGTEPQDAPVVYVTVKEPVTMGGANGSFLTLLPARDKALHLQMDCAVDFPNAMGKQRIRFNLSRRRFCYGALARTNTTAAMMLYAQTVGKLFADIRNLGYTNKNILIAGRRRYVNEPLLMHAGKSLEAVWHRALLDLLAALALVDDGRFVGEVVSYKAGHTLDVEMVRILSRYNLLQTVKST